MPGSGFGGFDSQFYQNDLLKAQAKQTQAQAKLVNIQAGVAKSAADMQKQLFAALFGDTSGGGRFGSLLDTLTGTIGGLGGGVGGTGGSNNNPGGLPTGVLPRDGGGSPGTGVLPRDGGGSAPSTGGFGSGQRAALSEQFDIAGRTALAQLEERGLGSSSLIAPALSGVERQRGLAMGELDESIVRQRTTAQAPIFNMLSQLLGGIF